MSTASAFEEAVLARYGPPSLREGGQWFWFYDLDGRQLDKEGGAFGNCLLTMEFWRRESLPTSNVDLGPWGCALVMTLAHGTGGTVSSYRIELVSGYAKALNHFLTRVQELDDIKAHMNFIEGVEPEL